MSWLRQLGSTGIEVSALGLGTVKLGRDQGVKYPRGFTIPDDSEATALINQARDLGINLIDTAPAYGNSEERLGQLLRGQRGHWVICTKVGEEFDGSQSSFDFSPEHTRFSVQRSLQRLRTDVIDMVLVHSNGDDLDIIQRWGTLEALDELKSAGLIRAFGMSTKTVAGGRAAARAADLVMLTYNLAQREEAAVLDACAELGKGALVKKALASGHLQPVADPVQAAMDLVFGHPATGAAIVGTINPEHLRGNVEAARRSLQK
ncbi:aldo/keto reductase [Pseudohalioglobus sediminis]|uniref:Aldo/keto reductase n=1 Tax=Pseudohalioglobus sediminis TaxID=2606449 RepID=A0A5B0WU74_9GAMM|nr:aldo/keto reductase [Pseudohalioglobus sediminis]KAA1190630.1 aldo/keto reductase [Pseudohalioglobus sediminis]